MKYFCLLQIILYLGSFWNIHVSQHGVGVAKKSMVSHSQLILALAIRETQEAAKYGLAAPNSLFCYFVFHSIINLPSASLACDLALGPLCYEYNNSSSKPGVWFNTDIHF